MNTINVINKGMENHLRQNAVDTPIISVIIPVYKVEDYLDRCLQSILNQTYKNLEIILVDDGSPDKCPEMCDKYAEEHVNIRVIHKENGGQSSARNVGLNVASGEYIGFVDSDDWIAPDMYEYLLHLIQTYEADAADIKCFQTDGISVNDARPNELVQTFSGNDILRQYMYRGLNEQKGAPYAVWRKLYKSSVIKDERFDVGTLNEDICYNFIALSKCKRYVESNQIKYYYFQNPNSTTGGKLKRKDFDLLIAADQLIELAEKNGNKEIIRLAKMKRARSDFSLLMRAVINGTDDVQEESLRQLQKNIRNNFWLLLSSPMPLNRKAMIAAISISYKPL